MKEFISIITGLIGLATAWVAYQATVKRSITNAEQRARVLAINDPTVGIDYWKPTRVLWVQGVIGFIYVLVLLFWLGDDPVIPISAAAGVGIGMSIFLFVRKKPPSRVMRSTSIVIAEEQSEAVKRCLEALQKIGARIARLDQESGLIQARVPLSFWSYGNIVNVSVVSDRSNRSEIHVSSDSILPSVVFDFGYNARILRRITSQLLGP
jgi:hypothetical protein